MYAGVPTAVPTAVSRGSERKPSNTSSPVCVPGSSVSGRAAGRRRARPQSITQVSPAFPMITLDGLRSRWMTPRPCA